MSDDLTLAIDASTYRGTVAVIAGERVLATAEVAMRGEREERLMPAIAAALGNAGLGIADLTRVVAGGGPGSFTSLRIGAALAKGICTAAALPLSAVSSLALLVAGADRVLRNGRYLAILDAMRGDMYAALVEWHEGAVVAVADARLVPRSEVLALAAEHGADLVGVGVAASIESMPHARGVATIAARLVQEVSLESWEPEYGRLAEAQVKWEAQHGRRLAAG